MEKSPIIPVILKDKEGLLSYGEETANKIEFIFSHSALGVGWDNPNIFNIATLNLFLVLFYLQKQENMGKYLYNK